MRTNIYLLFIALFIPISSIWAQEPGHTAWDDITNNTMLYDAIDAPNNWGSAPKPFLIDSEDDLRKLAQIVNRTDGFSTGLSGDRNALMGIHFELTEDIELSGESAPMTPIGTWGNPGDRSFHGTFDGKGFLISNLFINAPIKSASGGDYYYAGLFGVSRGTIKNLGVQGKVVLNNSYNATRTALLLGCNEKDNSDSNRGGKVENCYAIGDIEYTSTFSGSNLNSRIGLLVGFNEGDSQNDTYIKNCYAVGTITTSYVGSGSGLVVGGLVGLNIAPIINSYAILKDSSTGTSGRRGSLVGHSEAKGSITNSYADDTTPVGFTGTMTAGYTINVSSLSDINGVLGNLPTAAWATSGVINFYPYLGKMENGSDNMEYIRTVIFNYTAADPSKSNDEIKINNGARVVPSPETVAGYFWSEDGTDVWDVTKSVLDDITLTLTSYTYTIDFSAGSAGEVFEGVAPTYTQTISFNETVPADLPDEDDAKRIGYTLDGWTYNGSSILTTSDDWATLFGVTIPANSSTLILDAEWKANEYTLVFDAGVAGSFSPAIGDITGIKYDDTSISLPSLTGVSVTNAGYRNPKWTYNGVAITGTTTWEDLLDTYTKANPSDGKITITADWLPESLFITFDFKGGNNGGSTTPPENEPASYNEPIDFWPLGMNLDGHIFKGWKSANGGTVFTSAADFWSSIVSTDLTPGNEIVLEAQWELAPTSLVPPGGGSGSGSGSGGWYYMTIKSTFAGNATNVTYRVEGGRDFDFYVDMAGLEADDILMVYANSKLLTPDYYDNTKFVVPSVNSNTTITINVEKRGQATSNELMSNTTNISVAMRTISIDVSKVSTIQIVSISGNVVYNNRVDGTITVNVPAGIYVVVVDGKTTKVVVR